MRLPRRSRLRRGGVWATAAAWVWGVIGAACCALLVGCGGGGGGGGGGGSGGVTSAPTSTDDDDDEWLIPRERVVDGGPGRDGIPAIDNPVFLRIDREGGSDRKLVVGYRAGSEVKAMPHDILDWHEIVNDTLGGEPVALTYCPLTGSALLWKASTTARDPTFGVSGLLYNSNLIPYDRETESHWLQMLVQSVEGPRAGDVPETLPVVETTLGTWREMYPDSALLTRQTGYDRNYDEYPYRTHRTDDNLLFEVEPLDVRMQIKTRVLGVWVGDTARAWRIEDFGPGITVHNDTIGDVPIVVAGSADHNLAVAFGRTLDDGTVLSFEPSSAPLPAIVTDDEGNTWDVFGEALEGTRTTERLPLVNSHVAFWFAWGAFHPDSEIAGQ